MPEPILMCPRFTNAHSHWEYRGFQGRLEAPGYWDWLRELTQLKCGQTPEEVATDCQCAASENARAGIGVVGEHSDRFGSEHAASQLRTGILYQEVITVLEAEHRSQKLELMEQNFRAKAAQLPSSWRMGWAPHAPFTVDRETLRAFAVKSEPISIHVAEHDDENALFRTGEGQIAAFYRANEVPVVPTGQSSVAYLLDQGFAGRHVQYVHTCSVDDADIEQMQRAQVGIAHCPRSNHRLGSRTAPVRRLLAAGLEVGIGLDSAASSGPINMLAEMRMAYQVALDLGEPLTVAQIWNMATEMGARSLNIEPLPLQVGDRVSMIALPIPASEEPERWLLESDEGNLELL